MNYEVQRLFSANVGPMAYACSVSPEAPKRLFVSATGDQGARRYIKLVNVGDESVQVTLDVSSGLRTLGGLRRRTPTMRVETLHGRPQDKRSLEYMGPARVGAGACGHSRQAIQRHAGHGGMTGWCDRPDAGRARSASGAGRRGRAASGEAIPRGAGAPLPDDFALSFQVAQDAGAAVLDLALSFQIAQDAGAAVLVQL